MAITQLTSNGIYFQQSGVMIYDDQLYCNSSNFGYLEDMLAAGYVENTYYYNVYGRTQVHYFSKTGTAAYPQIFVTDTPTTTGDIVYSGITSQRNSLTVIVPAGYSIYVQSGGTIYSWTCNFYSE